MQESQSNRRRAGSRTAGTQAFCAGPPLSGPRAGAKLPRQIAILRAELLRAYEAVMSSVHFTKGQGLLVLIASFALACGAEEDGSPFPLEMESEFGLFRAVLSPTSEPLVVGSNDFELEIVDLVGGGGAERLDLQVVPWMPHHDHGSPSEPSVEELGGGRYRIRDVAFNMEGEWELRIVVSREPVQDRFVASFRV